MYRCPNIRNTDKYRCFEEKEKEEEEEGTMEKGGRKRKEEEATKEEEEKRHTLEVIRANIVHGDVQHQSQQAKVVGNLREKCRSHDNVQRPSRQAEVIAVISRSCSIDCLRGEGSAKVSFRVSHFWTGPEWVCVSVSTRTDMCHPFHTSLGETTIID